MLTADGETTAAFGDSSINYDVGAVGTFEQMLKRGEDFNKNGLSSAITEMIKKGEEYKGGKIRIVFPMIDYGYTGTFNNIEISVHEQNERLSTATRDEYTGGVTGFTGSVTIEKYSPSTMKGSYSGTLYRYVDANLPYRGPLPHQRVKIIVGAGTGSVNGEFTIINPWKDDDRISDGIDYQSAIVDPMKDDIKRMVDKYGIDVDVDGIFEQVDANQKRNQRSSSSAISIYGDCNCSCNFVKSALPLCKVTCEDAFKACEGERYTPPLTIVPIDPNLQPEEGEQRISSTLEEDQKFSGVDKEDFEKFINNELTATDDIRAKYIALLEEKHPGEQQAPLREMMIKGFDSMPDENSKMMMYRSLEGS